MSDPVFTCTRCHAWSRESKAVECTYDGVLVRSCPACGHDLSCTNPHDGPVAPNGRHTLSRPAAAGGGA